jgi:flagellar biosynthetic protein FliO
MIRKIEVIMRILSLLFFMFSTYLFGDEKNPVEGQTYNYASQFVNMLLTLGFVLLLIFASVWLLKKLMRSRLQTMNRANGIKILERRPLNPKACLYLVDILGKGVVISESPAGIHVVTEFAEGIDVEALLDEQMQEKEPSTTLSQTVTGTLKKLMRKNA